MSDFIIVHQGVLADGLRTKSYQIYSKDDDGAYYPTTICPNDPVPLSTARVRLADLVMSEEVTVEA